MTTLVQLDKFSDKWFNNQMRRRGFAVEKKSVFWRKRGPLYDMLLPQILTGGELLRIHLTIWSPWVDSVEGELGKFPPDSYLIGGTLSDEFPGQLHGGELFEISTEKNMEESLQAILRLIDQRALPWFRTVNSYETYVAYVGAPGYRPTPERQNQVKQGIARGYEREPY